jgi:4-amino-4-deoxy-L-arabinose transferase-like glycosyltransferase
MTSVAEARALLNRAMEPQAQTGLPWWVAAGLKYVLLFLSALSLVAYVVVACLRMGYPYELEWIEGGMVDHVRWILSGRSLYVPPSLEFVPNYYTPLYFYLGAALSKIMGVGFFPLRLISFVSSLGCFWMIAGLVRRETGGWAWAIVSMGLFAASYRATGAWMDIARIDSLFLFLALAAAYMVRFRQDTPGLIAAGLLMGLSFLAKQSALIIAGPLILFTLLANKGWTRLAFAATFVGLVAGTTLLFNEYTDGWYSRYVFSLPNQHPYVKAAWASFWLQDIGRNFAVAASMTILALALGRSPQRHDGLFYGMLFAGMVGTSWLSRLHEGGYDNVLMPAAAALAIGFGLGADRPLFVLDAACDAPALRRTLAGTLCLAGIWQFVLLAYLPGQQVPGNADRRSGDAMVKTLARLPGDALLPEHGYLHALAGRNTFHAHAGAIWAVLLGTDKELKDALLDGYRRAILSRRYDVLVLDELARGKPDFVQKIARQHSLPAGQVKGPSFLELFRHEIEDNYQCIGSLFQRNDVFWPVTGVPVRPGQIYVRKDKVAMLALPDQATVHSPAGDDARERH